MSPLATGVIILASLATFALGFAAIALSGSRGRSPAALVIIVPVTLAVGSCVALLLGYRLPWPELSVAIPIAIGLVTAVLSRSIGYGLLAGLIIAVTLN